MFINLRWVFPTYVVTFKDIHRHSGLCLCLNRLYLLKTYFTLRIINPLPSFSYIIIDKNMYFYFLETINYYIPNDLPSLYACFNNACLSAASVFPSSPEHSISPVYLVSKTLKKTFT